MRSILFIFLLPFFFVFHGYVENFRFINFSDCLVLIAVYGIVTLAIFLLFLLLLKHRMKAALMTIFIMSFYFFFGALHDFFRKNGIFLHKYSIIIPLFLLLAFLLFLYLKKRQPAGKTALFLNTLLIIYILVDAATLTWQYQWGAKPGKFTSGIQEGLYTPCDNCPKPDIYLLLFDEYSGNTALKNFYHYDNSGLDSFLEQQGFRIQTKSRSNYNFTPFSMTSLFNTSYLTNIKDPLHVTADDYIEVSDPGRKLAVFPFLEKQGYSIINNSTFDLPKHPSVAEQPFIPLKTKLITNRTLLNYLIRDLGWWLIIRFHHSLPFVEEQNESMGRLNRMLIDKTIEESKRPASGARFVYMHVFMPHIPFLYDSLQRPRSLEEVTQEHDHPSFRSYLNYLPYTNARVKEVISAIKKNTGGKAVIIFMSDHGARLLLPGHSRNPYCFYNQNAIYLPGGDYHLFYDSITNVNEFRVVFNQLFHQYIPLLKDSTIFLSDVTP